MRPHLGHSHVGLVPKPELPGGGLAPTPLPPRSWWELRPPRGPHHPPAQDRERPIPVPIPAPTAALRHRPAAGSRPRSRGCCYRPSFPPKNSPPHRGAQPWAESVAKTLRLGPDLPPPPPKTTPRGARYLRAVPGARGLLAHAGGTGRCRGAGPQRAGEQKAAGAGVAVGLLPAPPPPPLAAVAAEVTHVTAKNTPARRLVAPGPRLGEARGAAWGTPLPPPRTRLRARLAPLGAAAALTPKCPALGHPGRRREPWWQGAAGSPRVSASPCPQRERPHGPSSPGRGHPGTAGTSQRCAQGFLGGTGWVFRLLQHT